MLDKMTVKFKVAMGQKEKEAGDIHDVEMTILFPEGIENQVQADAVKHMIVKFQSQIRSNWEKFESDGVPKEITYGDPIYGSKRGGTRAPTEAEVADYISKQITKLTPEGIAEFAKTGKLPEDEKFYK